MQLVKIKLFKSKKHKNGKYPIVLQVNRAGYKRIFLPLEAIEKNFDDSIGRYRKNEDNHNQKNLILQKYEAMAGRLMDDYLLSGKHFDFEDFKQKFTTGKKTVGVYEMFETIIKENNAKEKLKTGEAYRDAMRSLKKYRPGKLNFTDIDYKFLKGYEKHLFERGVGGGGANLYIRTLRACYNEAIKRGFVQVESYPFKSQAKPNGYSFSHLKSTRKVRAINVEDLQKLKEYPPCLELDLWLFSYYCGGINLWDMTLLKSDNIYNDLLQYTRSKTGDKFTIKLREEAKEILVKYQGGEYLFPILFDYHETMRQKKDRLKRMAKQINKTLRSIAKKLNIDVRFTFYTARHTMASVLLDRGVDPVTIQSVLGHTNLKTTQGYLESLKKNAVDDAISVL